MFVYDDILTDNATDEYNDTEVTDEYRAIKC